MVRFRFQKLRWIALMAGLWMVALAACAPAATDASAAFPAASQDQAEDSSFTGQLVRIELRGTLEQIQEQSLVVNGQSFRIDEQSVVVSALKVGDRVQVKAILLPDNSRYAQSVLLDQSDDDSGSFKFYGFVEAIGQDVWQISSFEVQVNSQTAVSAGIQVGDFVEVEGRALNNQWVAEKISLEDDRAAAATSTPGVPGSGEVEFYGKIESIQNGVYVIGGRTVRTTAGTEIKGALALGMMVKVHATLQADGGYLAREIEPENGDNGSSKSGDDDKSGDDNSGKGSGDDDDDDDNSGKGGDDDDRKGDDDYGKGKGK
ncbi:MAG: DUF5666 domain-containing protein [Bellilinea sp.]